jgi:hypothetical protein
MSKTNTLSPSVEHVPVIELVEQGVEPVDYDLKQVSIIEQVIVQPIEKTNVKPVLTGNDKRKESCKKVGGIVKEKGHKREGDFNKEFNPSALGNIEYGATSDCVISTIHPIVPVLQTKFGINSYNTSNKSGGSIQFTLGSIPELNCDNNLEYIKNKENSRQLFFKYLKKSGSERPADLLVYKNKQTKNWEFFKMDDIIEYIVNKCKWRKLSSDRLKGDFVDNSKKGIRQYLTYEYRATHKSYLLGLNSGKGIQFIDLLKSKTHGIDYLSKPY